MIGDERTTSKRAKARVYHTVQLGERTPPESRAVGTDVIHVPIKSAITSTAQQQIQPVIMVTIVMNQDVYERFYGLNAYDPAKPEPTENKLKS